MSSKEQELALVLRGTAEFLRYQKSLGVDGVDLPESILKNIGPMGSAEGEYAAAPTSLSGGLQGVREELGDCQRCKLCSTRTHIVFGVGSPAARLMFVGEGPGRDEDLQGEPFVGRAGQLLTRMISAMGLSRQEVYIANIVKCRPPQNRDPEPDEVAACEPFLMRQISVVQPDVIVALGRYAAQALLRDSTAISRLRGK
jgi:DNA polymerase